MNWKLVLPFLLLCGTAAPAIAAPPEAARKQFLEALDLVHAYTGAGDEMRRAMTMAEDLAQAQPDSGYSQALQAEALSTWQLNQRGQPEELRNHVIQLADEALRLNPKLALGHVAKGRAYVRASMLDEARAEVDAALKLDPKFSGAIFLRAEVYRRSGNLEMGDAWYRKFIASTSSQARKSNGYYWIGKMYDDAAWDNKADAPKLIPKARAAYQQGVDVNPDSAWGNVNFAIFLNEQGDFDAAEKYALKALAISEFPMARYHLAAARFQRVWSTKEGKERGVLQKAVDDVAESSGVSLDGAMSFSFSSSIMWRLNDLREDLQDPPEAGIEFPRPVGTAPGS